MKKAKADEEFVNAERIYKLETKRDNENRKILKNLHMKVLKGKINPNVVRRHIIDM
jgi:hypothetical protein